MAYVDDDDVRRHDADVHGVLVRCSFATVEISNLHCIISGPSQSTLPPVPRVIPGAGIAIPAQWQGQHERTGAAFEESLRPSLHWIAAVSMGTLSARTPNLSRRDLRNVIPSQRTYAVR